MSLITKKVATLVKRDFRGEKLLQLVLRRGNLSVPRTCGQSRIAVSAKFREKIALTLAKLLTRRRSLDQRDFLTSEADYQRLDHQLAFAEASECSKSFFYDDIRRTNLGLAARIFPRGQECGISSRCIVDWRHNLKSGGDMQVSRWRVWLTIAHTADWYRGPPIRRCLFHQLTKRRRVRTFYKSFTKLLWRSD